MVNITTPLLIIGAALPRTATTSIAAALERLGYHVFHATTFSSAMWPIWNNIAQADVTNNTAVYRASMDRFVEQLSLEGFNATLDQPSCFVYQQLMEYYPDAKVLQTKRSPAGWARSMVELVYSMDIWMWRPPYNRSWNVVNGPFGYWSKRQLGLRDEEIYPDGVPNTTNRLESQSSVSLASAEAAYQRYQDQVQAHVPPDKLVSFAASDGWGPLCEHFLPPEASCPTDEPFPRTNSKHEGFFLDFHHQVITTGKLYRLHPLLAKQTWLVNLFVKIWKLQSRLKGVVLLKLFRQNRGK